MRKPNAAEIMQLALEPDIDLEYEHVLRMSDEEIRKNLRARGHDLRVLEAEADIHWGMFRPRARVHGGIIAGSIAFMTTATAVAATMLAPFASAAPQILATAASPPPAPPEQAIREAAFTACHRGSWQACLDKLDEARALDPEGEDQSAVQIARNQAVTALGKKGGQR